MRCKLFSSGISALLLFVAGNTVQTAMALESVRIHDDTGVISVQGSNLKASDIARELGLKLDINVVITGNAETPLDLDIVEEPLGQAIAKISPNNLVVRQNSDPASPIVEIVMMMASTSSGTISEVNNTVQGSEFLPSGDPVDLQQLDAETDLQDLQFMNDESDIDESELYDPYELRDPGRMMQVREAAAAAAADSSLPPVQIPPMFTPGANSISDSLGFDQ